MEHFNENYVESEKFPKASFKGVFAEGEVKGALSIHGITQEISVPASLTQEDGNFVLVTSFEILLADYGVKIPSAVANKISNTVDGKRPFYRALGEDNSKRSFWKLLTFNIIFVEVLLH